MIEPGIMEAIVTPFGTRDAAFHKVRPNKVNPRSAAIAHGHAPGITIVERIQN